MYTSDVIKFVGAMSSVLGGAMFIIVLMMDDRRRPMAFILVLIGATLIAGGFVRDRNNVPYTQVYLTRALYRY